jgi:hypothetical protein
MENDMVVFLSWHNSLPGLIRNVYSNFTLPKSFISTDFVNGLDNNRLMAADNSFKASTNYSIINLLENLNPSHIVVWNGDFNDSKRGFQVKLISLIKSTFPNIKFVYCEHGWLPQKQTFSIDSAGSNGSSSFAKATSFPMNIDLSPVRNKRSHYERAADKPNVDNFIYMPLQLNTDTQIKMHSPFFKDMKDFILHIASIFPDKQLVVKGHPKDLVQNHIRYNQICNSLYNVKYVSDQNNIGYCKYADCVIAINSTAVNEALIFQKPVMTYGKNNFSNKGVTYEVNDVNDISFQRNFLNYKPDLDHIEQYLCYLLSLQFDSTNPNMKKVLRHFKIKNK